MSDKFRKEVAVKLKLCSAYVLFVCVCVCVRFDSSSLCVCYLMMYNREFVSDRIMLLSVILYCV